MPFNFLANTNFDLREINRSKYQSKHHSRSSSIRIALRLMREYTEKGIIKKVEK